MKLKNLENHLALLAAVIVLVGVSFAAEDALAKETRDVTNMAVADDVAASALKIAEKASKDSAARAAESLALDVMIDLDIKLADTRSTLIAGKE
ncbi:MAG: hypothetical protein QNJ14_07990 [Woeseiaceae bacterium]|nr:hypothetical protein [Woeseiaceae bacterium]